MDLTNQNSWHLVCSELNHENIKNGAYNPLPKIRLIVSSPVVSIKIDSWRVKPRWYRACWVSLYADILGVSQKIAKSPAVELNTQEIITFDVPVDITPYTLELSFPSWLSQVKVTVLEYIDQSGVYLIDSVSRALDELNAKIIGENIVFSSVKYQELIDGTTTLQQSIFTGTTKYERYEVGRFYRIDTGEKLSDPLLTVRPGGFTATFTGLEKLPPNVVTVSVKPL